MILKDLLRSGRVRWRPAPMSKCVGLPAAVIWESISQALLPTKDLLRHGITTSASDTIIRFVHPTFIRRSAKLFITRGVGSFQCPANTILLVRRTSEQAL